MIGNLDKITRNYQIKRHITSNSNLGAFFIAFLPNLSTKIDINIVCLYLLFT